MQHEINLVACMLINYIIDNLSKLRYGLHG